MRNILPILEFIVIFYIILAHQNRLSDQVFGFILRHKWKNAVLKYTVLNIKQCKCIIPIMNMCVFYFVYKQ